MSRNSSMSFRAESGTVLNLVITFTLIMWGVMWCSGMKMFRNGGFLHLGTLLGHKDCYLAPISSMVFTSSQGSTIWVILAHFCWTGNYHQLSWEFLRILLILLITCGIKVFSCFSCCVCGSSPTLGANIMSLTNPFAATAGTNTRNTAFKIVHSDLLNNSQNFYQQCNNANNSNSHTEYHTIKCSIFTRIQK